MDDSSGLLVAGAHNHKLHIYRREGGALACVAEVALGEGPINCVRVAHNEGFERDIFAACYSGKVVRVSADGEIKDKLAVHEGAVKALRIHPTRPLGVSCSADGSLLQWPLGGGAAQHFRGHTAIVDDVDIDPSGEMIVSVSRDFTLKVYSLLDGKLLHSLLLGHRSPKSVCFFSTETVIVGDYWGSLIKADLTRGKLSRKQIASNGISSLSREGRHLLAASYDGACYLVRPDDMDVVNTLRAMVQRTSHSVVV